MTSIRQPRLVPAEPRIVVLSGAGLSAESGLSTFRDPDGVWARHDLSEVASPQGFARNPDVVHEFYNARRKALRDAVPNPGHHALARLESECDLTVITQNVDDLHERAGSRSVLHMHGELASALCDECGFRWPAPDSLSVNDRCGRCGGSAVRPDIVWFGEIPYHLPRIDELLSSADIFAAVGTSGEVSPANSFVVQAGCSGASTIELNLERTAVSDAFDEIRIGPAAETVPIWVNEILDR